MRWRESRSSTAAACAPRDEDTANNSAAAVQRRADMRGELLQGGVRAYVEVTRLGPATLADGGRRRSDLVEIHSLDDLVHDSFDWQCAVHVQCAARRFEGGELTLEQ